MNNKGFTLIELLATIIILSIIVGITLGLVGGNFSKAKEGTEDVFVDTIKNAMSMYLSSDAKELDYNYECPNLLSKTHGNVKVYKATTNFKAVIDSQYHPISQEDLVNPANEDDNCADANTISVDIYRDEDYVYYYSINKSDLVCLNKMGDWKLNVISNLPILTDAVGNEVGYYICG